MGMLSRVAADEIVLLSTTMFDNANKTNELLSDVIPDIQRNSVLMQEVTAASNEQIDGIGNINCSVQELQDGSNETVMVSNRMAEESKTLSEQFKLLNKAIEYFK